MIADDFMEWSQATHLWKCSSPINISSGLQAAINKGDLGLDLVELERAAAIAIEEQESSKSCLYSFYAMSKKKISFCLFWSKVFPYIFVWNTVKVASRSPSFKKASSSWLSGRRKGKWIGFWKWREILRTLFHCSIICRSENWRQTSRGFIQSTVQWRRTEWRRQGSSVRSCCCCRGTSHHKSSRFRWSQRRGLTKERTRVSLWLPRRKLLKTSVFTNCRGNAEVQILHQEETKWEFHGESARSKAEQRDGRLECFQWQWYEWIKQRVVLDGNIRQWGIRNRRGKREIMRICSDLRVNRDHATAKMFTHDTPGFLRGQRQWKCVLQIASAEETKVNEVTCSFQCSVLIWLKCFTLTMNLYDKKPRFVDKLEMCSLLVVMCFDVPEINHVLVREFARLVTNDTTQKFSFVLFQLSKFNCHQ